METIQISPVKFTAGAIAEIKRLYTQQSEIKYLRVGVKGGGCSGLSYVLDFDNRQQNDELFETNGIQCIIDKSHKIYLEGMEIHWDNGLNNRGFTFINPNASKTCGCGSSFAV